MKRDVVQVGILALLATVLIAAYLFIQNQETPSRIARVFELQKDEAIVELKIQNQYGSFEFEKLDGQWRFAGQGNGRADQERLVMMESMLADLMVTRVLTEDEPEYGLNAPSMEIAFRTNTGDDYELHVGNQTISKAQYYAKSNGKFVYLLDMGYLTSFDASATAFRDKEIFTVDMDRIQRLTYYQNGDLVVDLGKAEDQWELLLPYQAAAREIEIQEFLVQLKQLQAVDQVDPQAPLEELGLAEPKDVLILTDADGRSQQLALGSQEGPYRYLQRMEEQDSYLIYDIDLDLTGMRPDQLLFVPPFRATIDQVANISIEIEGKSFEFQLDAEAEQYVENGLPISRGDMVSVFMKFITVMADGYEPFEAVGQPAGMLKMQLKDGQAVQVDLYPREEGGYYMAFEGERRFYVGADRIDKLIYWSEKPLVEQ